MSYNPNHLQNFNLRMCCLDTALENTGYCILLVSTGNFSHKIEDIGTITTDAGIATDTRVRSLLTQLTPLWNLHNINCVLTEKPGEAVYKPKKFGGESANGLIGRAMSISKVNAAVFGVVGLCHAINMYCRTIEPGEWQPHFKKAKMAKPWSIREANIILARLNYQHKKLIGKDEHIADSINIGSKAIMKYYRKEWEIPRV